ncbi:MAG: UDP-N-acetylmuramoyl-tripeptide--D-alanyl-D-alanine ligase, partial [Streptococcaceae bacterium]|nr:UDP-N-acetylmuramoyl-tripeptide--D-alanyl-D-alanine ligase [Streptococcaceae bacterium]
VNFMDSPLTLPLPGKFNATNAMLAAYVGTLVHIPEEKIVQALAQVSLTANRTEWKKASNGADILSDVYNANPTAMKLILETFQAIPRNEKGKKIVVLADMLELGKASAELHAGMMKALDFDRLDSLYLYGQLMKNLDDNIPENEKHKVHYYEKLEDLQRAVITHVQPRDQILLKGSNSMKLGEIVEGLENGEN